MHFGYMVMHKIMTLTAFASCILQGNISGGNRRLKTSSGPTTGRVCTVTALTDTGKLITRCIRLNILENLTTANV